jgi:polyisoprenyl-teichoic acid--peptidoglycan teichoic acid transferase
VPQDSTPPPSSDDSPATIDAAVAAAPATGKSADEDPVPDDPETDTSGEPVAEAPVAEPPVAEPPVTESPAPSAAESPAESPEPDPADPDAAADAAPATEADAEQPRDETTDAAPVTEAEQPRDETTDAAPVTEAAPVTDAAAAEDAADAGTEGDPGTDGDLGTDGDPEAAEETEPHGDAEPDATEDQRPRAGVAAVAAAAKGPAAKDPAAKVRGAVESPWDLEPGWDPSEEKEALRRLTTRRRGPVWARALVALGAVLVLASVTGLIAGKALLDRYAGSVHQESLLGGARATVAASGVGGGEVAAAPIDGPLNILLVGIDERTYAPSDGARADSIIIVHVPADHQSAYFISVPRDSRVQIPAYPKTGYEGGTDKINAAFAYGFLNGGGRAGGFELLGLTLKQLTGISFNAGAIIDFDGFRSVVDAMGGVNMCVDEQTISVHTGWDASGKETPPYRIVPPDYTAVKIPGVRPQVYDVGCQTMEGWEALDYVRQRELLPDGDYGRQRHQQQFLKAVAKKLTSLGVITNPLKLDSVLRSAANTLTFDGGGYSVTDWLFNLKGISPGNITMMKTNAGQFNTEYHGGQAFEILDQTSLDLFQAAKDDTVDQFVQSHPDWVSGDTAPLPSSGSPSPSN